MSCANILERLGDDLTTPLGESIRNNPKRLRHRAHQDTRP